MPSLPLHLAKKSRLSSAGEIEGVNGSGQESRVHQVNDCRSELKSLAPVLASVNCERVLTLSLLRFPCKVCRTGWAVLQRLFPQSLTEGVWQSRTLAILNSIFPFMFQTCRIRCCRRDALNVMNPLRK